MTFPLDQRRRTTMAAPRWRRGAWRAGLALWWTVSLAGGGWAQNVTVHVDTTAAGRQQVIDGFGTCLGSSEAQQPWWQNLYYDDLGASMLRVDLSPNFASPYSDHAYNSPSWAQPGDAGKFSRPYTGPQDYGRSFDGQQAPIAVMGPDIEANQAYFNFGADNVKTYRAAAQAGLQRLGANFKLFGSLWSPAPWVKVSSGHAIGATFDGGPAQGTAWPFIWLGCFAGGKLDLSGQPLAVFQDSTGVNTTSLTQFTRSTAAYVHGLQKALGVNFYAISLQNELTFEEFYNSCTYPLSDDYIAALKALRAEFDLHPDLQSVKIMGPEDLMGGDPYGMWQYGGGSTTTHKNLQIVSNVQQDPQAAAALAFFCLHGYASDGVQSAGSNPTQWGWWAQGWTQSPSAGLPDTIAGFTSFQKKSWMTETSGESPAWLSPTTGFPGNGGWSIALKIHQALTAGRESGWAYWQFTDGKAVGGETLTDATSLGQSPKVVAARHFFRVIPPGSVRVDARTTDAAGASADDQLYASAYLDDAAGSLSVVLINPTTQAKVVSLPLPAAPAGIASFDAYTSSQDNYWQHASVTVTGGQAQCSVPAYGIVSLVGRDGGSSVTPTPTPTPVTTRTPTATPVPVPTPTPTGAPRPTPDPTPTPVGPTPTPTPAPALSQVGVQATRAVASPAQPGEFLVTRTGDLSGSLNVWFRVKGSAVPGVDYQPLVHKKRFRPGQATTQLRVNVLAGETAGRTVKLVVIPAKNGGGGTYGVGGPGQARVQLEKAPTN